MVLRRSKVQTATQTLPAISGIIRYSYTSFTLTKEAAESLGLPIEKSDDTLYTIIKKYMMISATRWSWRILIIRQ